MLTSTHQAQTAPSVHAARPFTRGELLSALGIVLIWGTNFVVMKTALRHFTPLQLGAGRYLLAVLPLLFFVRPPRLHWRWVVLYGLTQGLGRDSVSCSRRYALRA